MSTYRVMQHKGSGSVRVQEEVHAGYWAWVTSEKATFAFPRYFASVAEAQTFVAGQQAMDQLAQDELWEEVD
jgi:hypothetical protein